MPTFVIVNEDKDPLGPNEINAGDTISVNDGDVFIIDATADAKVKFESATGNAIEFSVEINASNSNSFDIEFEDDLSPSISIADNVNLSRVKIDAEKTDSISLTAGNNITLEEYIGSKDGADTLTIGNDFTTTSDLDTEGGDDLISIGSGATLRNIRTGDGNDTLIFGDNLVANDIRTDDGDDIVSIGDNAQVNNVDTGNGNDDLTIGDDFDGNRVRVGRGDDAVRIGADASSNRIDGGQGNDTLNTQSSDADDRNFETVNVVCVVRGTRIETGSGEVEIEALRRGDLVMTSDHGLQPIRWIGSSVVSGRGHLAPIQIRKGALGNTRDLSVSPQHRMMVRGWRADLHFATNEVLVPAKHLANGTSIRSVPCDEVEYFHILFDTHEILLAEGAESESFHPGAVGIGSMDDDVREEIFEIFPHLSLDAQNYGPSARMSLKKQEAQLLQFGSAP